MITLTTPVKVPNITKWKVAAFTSHDDDSPPWAEITIQVQGAGGVVYCARVLPLFDAQPSYYIFANPAPVGYLDLIATGTTVIASAYTSVFNAINTATGGRAAKLQAAEAVLLSLGIVDASLTGT